MDGYVAVVVAYSKPYPKLFNVEIMDVANGYDDYINVKCADGYFHYCTLCAMGTSI